MKVLITERQYRLLTESGKVTLFQEILDEEVNNIKTACEEMSSETFPDYLSFNDCDEIAIVENIEILSAEYKKDKNLFQLNLKINYRALSHNDFIELSYTLEQRMKRRTGIKFWLVEEENNNLNTNKNW
jgi:ABC-type uncharacterized transport system ATPase component